MNPTLISIAKQYIDNGQHLFPLKPNSKEPACSWSTAPPISLSQLTPESPNNLAVKLKPDQLVIDVDVKHGAPGKESYEKLCKAVPAVSLMGYTTVTASGGIHIYLTLPPNTDASTLVKKHPDYPGIDFLKVGNYCVLAGSITDGVRYTSNPQLQFPFPTAPTSLIALLTRTTSSTPLDEDITPTDGGWGCLTPAELTDTLLPLDPKAYNRLSDGDWLSLAMSCHYATAGMGFDEFNRWSMGDPDYMDDGEKNATRWRSFSTQSGRRNITAYWLRNELKNRGCPSALLEYKLDEMRRGSLFEPVNDDPTQIYKERIAAMSSEGEATLILEQASRDKALNQIHLRSIQEALRAKFPRVLTTAVTGQIIQGNTANYNAEQWADKIVETVGGTKCITFCEGSLWLFQPRHGLFGKVTQKQVTNHITLFLKSNGIQQITKTLVEDIRYFIEGKVADDEFFNDVQNPTMWNLINGELHMSEEGFTLLPHNPDSRRRNVIPVKFDPNCRGESKVWNEYLDTAIYCEDREISYTKLAIGIAYTLTECAPWLKKAWYVIGPSQTGKSKVIELIGHLTGRNFSASSWSYIQSNTFALSGLVGKLANLQGETNQNERVITSYFKQVVAGDPVRAEIKGQPAFVFSNRAVFWSAANEVPKFATEDTQGVMERICLIRLTNPRRPENRRETLLQEFIDDMQEIFHWAIYQFHREYYRDRCFMALEQNTAIEQEELEWMNESLDPVSIWFEERVELTGDGKHVLFNDEAYEDFMAFSAANEIQHKIWNQKAFGWAFRRALDAQPGIKQGGTRACRRPDGTICRGRRAMRLKLDVDDRGALN